MKIHILIFFSFHGTPLFSNRIILPPFPGSSQPLISNTPPLINNNAPQNLTSTSLLSSQQLINPSTTQQHQLFFQQSQASSALDKNASLLSTAAQQAKKFRPFNKQPGKSNKYIPKPIPSELGNLKTYSKSRQCCFYINLS